MYEYQIAQVIGRIPHLTPTQIAACNAAGIPAEPHGAAVDAVGDRIDAIMAQVAPETDAGVFAVARACVLGLIAEPVIAQDMAFALRAPWQEAVEPLDFTESVNTAEEITKSEPLEVGDTDDITQPDRSETGTEVPETETGNEPSQLLRFGAAVNGQEGDTIDTPRFVLS